MPGEPPPQAQTGLLHPGCLATELPARCLTVQWAECCGTQWATGDYGSGIHRGGTGQFGWVRGGNRREGNGWAYQRAHAVCDKEGPGKLRLIHGHK